MLNRKMFLVVGMLIAVFVAVIGLPYGKFQVESRISAAYESYTNLGQVIFVPGSPVYLYGDPGGTASVWELPVDADGNGFDSYIVWHCETVGGELWLGLFVGGEDPAWVPYSSIAGINPDYPFNPAVCPQ